MYLQGPLRRLIRRFKSTTVVHKNASSFLQLPILILDLIFDTLPLDSKVLLSQTCRVMRRLLNQACAATIRELPLSNRLELLTELANALPDHQVCSICYELHTVNTMDVPYRICYRRDYRCSVFSMLDSHHFGLRYYLTHYHVQLALKYHRLGSVYQEYLTSLLAPHSVVYPRGKPLALTFSARPRIAAGPRFILFTSWDFTDKHRTGPPSMKNLQALKFCPHLTFIQDPDPRLQENPLVCAIRSAFEAVGVEVHESCARCPTDCSVVVHRSGRILFRIWQDLGSFSSPGDLCWRIFLWNEENSDFWGPTVLHPPGSVRAMYIANDFE